MENRHNSPIGCLPEDWTLETLKSITTKIGSGSTPRGGESAYLSERSEYAFVRSQNVFDFCFNETSMKFISDTDAKKLKGVHLQKNDILLNITGDGITFARSCIVPDDILPAAVNQHVAIIRLDTTKCLPGYLLAYLCLPQIKEYIASFNAGGSRRAVTKAHIESFEIPLAPMKVQSFIQEVVFDFSNKIALNNRKNQTLESIAKTIFKSWFIDFDPVLDRALNAGNEIPEELSVQLQMRSDIKGSANVVPMPQDLLSLFPSKFEQNGEGDWIPLGWKVKPIKDVIERLNVGKKYSSKTVLENGKVPVLDQGKSGIIGYHNEQPSFKASPKDPVILFANHTCYMKLVMFDFSAIQNVLPFKGKNLNIYWVYMATIGRQVFQEYKGHWPDFSILPVCIANNGLDVKYGELVQPLFEKIHSNTCESEHLALVRDTLLPKLISGEVTISALQEN